MRSAVARLKINKSLGRFRISLANKNMRMTKAFDNTPTMISRELKMSRNNTSDFFNSSLKSSLELFEAIFVKVNNRMLVAVYLYNTIGGFTLQNDQKLI
jgi:hypothetical protein